MSHRDPESARIKVDLDMWSVERFRRTKELARVPTRWNLNPGYMHSFAVTENYFVLIEQPLCINITKMAKAGFIF